MNLRLWFVLPVSIIVFASFSSVFAGNNRKHTTSPEEFLFQAMIKLDQGLFDKTDLKKAEDFSQSNKELRQNFAAILGQYYRVMKNDPIDSLKTVGTFLGNEKEFKLWAREQEKGHKDALKQYKDAVNLAKREKRDPPEEPTGLFVPLPAISSWKIDITTSDCALEAARSLMDLGAYCEAVNILNRIGRDMESLPRILAAETGGDLFCKTGDYARSMEFYQFALKVLPSMRDEYTAIMAEDVKYIGNRIRASLDKVRILYEAELYGPGYAAYRDAESCRLGDTAKQIKQNLSEAIIRDELIEKEHANTIWAEAAMCYRIKSLLLLSEKTYAEKANKYIETLSDEIKTLHKKLALAKKAKAGKAACKKFEETINEKETHLVLIKGVPTGEDAYKDAKKRAKDFIKSKEFGLYRGEVMLDLGDYHAEYMLDPEMAEKCYIKAECWLKETVATDQALTGFEVPDAASDVSAPPPSSFDIDRWGNVNEAELKPGKVMNRKTCTWYIDSLRSRCYSRQGFLAFIDGDLDEAKALFKKMADADQRISFLVRDNQPNPYRRLLVRCRNGAFRRADKSALKCFSDKRRRYVVFLADYYAETEDPQNAQQLYRRLRNAEFGNLSPDEEAYTRFGLAWALWYDGVRSSAKHKINEAKQLLSGFESDRVLKKADITPRALSAYANMLCYGSDEEKSRSLEIYRLIAKKHGKTPYAETALYRMGTACLYSKDPVLYKEGIACLKRLIRKYEKGQYTTLANKVLQEAKENREHQDKDS